MLYQAHLVFLNMQSVLHLFCDTVPLKYENMDIVYAWGSSMYTD